MPMTELYCNNRYFKPTDPPGAYFIEHNVAAYRSLNNGTVMAEIVRTTYLQDDNTKYTFKYHVWSRCGEEEDTPAIKDNDPLYPNHHCWHDVKPESALITHDKALARDAANLDALRSGFTFDSEWV